MEALSPRSANIQFKAKPMKTKQQTEEDAKSAEAAKKAAKEKEYAQPPPDWVIQPPMSRNGLAEKFKTGRLLGKGGFAICYEGELRSKKQGANKTVFALKIVKSHMSQRKMEDKFRTELQIHAKMRHPNIVEFHRAFTFKESTYVVLELCSNGSIMDMVKKRRCLSLPEVRRFTVQLCGAIKYMHARNVIHRDLKMGNLFLDGEMNLKIGDFGLAAVLVSPGEYQGFSEYAKSRRTTLCGTPNYIAPEILEKGKGGHDHKVDIWAIGVIVFAMLAGQPPFQSASQGEIYRRARSVEYAWPEETKYNNDIPDEAKDLVAGLLKVDADERPDPDQVIGHPFFAMHGGDAIPACMDETSKQHTPRYIDMRSRPRGDVFVDGTERLSLRSLARHCGVGHLVGDKGPQPAVGADTHLTLYRECAEEEAVGAGPIVPLPQDMVYASKFPSTTWPSLRDIDSRSSTLVEDESETQISGTISAPIEVEAKRRLPERQLRGLVQSHAATLRAAHAGVMGPPPSRAPSGHLGLKTTASRSKDPIGEPSRARRGLLKEMPVRPPVVQSAPKVSTEDPVGRKTRATRGRKVIVLDDDVPNEPSNVPTLPRPMANDEVIDRACANPDEKRRDLAAKSKARIASNVQKEMFEPTNQVRKTSQSSETARSRDTSGSPVPGFALIGPDEVPEYLPQTKPDEVLTQLKKLKKELESSLSDISSAKDRSRPQDVEIRDKGFKHRPVVVKWVDYTNKFGIGYILANGTVGCVFRGDEACSPTCVVVADAETHLKKRKMLGYMEKHQIVPRRGSPIEFIENCGDEGLKRVLVQPSMYQIKVSSTGVPDRLGPGTDAFDFEKRKKLCLWDKFGKYMTQSLGKSEEVDLAVSQNVDTSSSTRSSKRNTPAGPFVKFYQRLGNVGIWGFGDGSFQFNFPDHTKLVVSDGGAWLDFYHLPLAAAQSVRAGEMLEAGALAERSVLCYPTTVLLGGRYRSHDFEAVVQANELRAKVGFVRDVVGMWAREGGLGCMGRKRGVKWEGMLEKGGKLVWVSVGARGGDGRYEMPAAPTDAVAAAAAGKV